MYAIKMDEAKTLVTTVYASIYEGEKNGDVIVFLLPKTSGTTNLADTNVFLRYVAPDGVGHSEILDLYPLPYNEGYYQYKLSVGSKFTAKAGSLELWLTAVNGVDEVILKSSPIIVEIKEANKIEPYLPDTDKDQLNHMEEMIAKLEKGKADSIIYDAETRQLQLTAENAPIGDAVTVPSDDYGDKLKEAVEDSWSDMESSEDAQGGEDWADM